jgi:hypothetical protein
MSFTLLSNHFLNVHSVEEKLDWKSLLAAGLIAAPGAAKEMPQKEQPAIVQKAVKPSSEEEFFYKIKHDLKKREGSTNFNLVKKLHRAPKDPTIGWGHSLKNINQSKAIFKKVIPEFDFDQIFNKQKPAELTEAQAEKLLNYDVKTRLDTLKRLYPDFFKYDYNTQQALFDLVYRGDLKYDVTKLLLAGEKEQATNLIRSRIQGSEQGVKTRVEDSIKKIKGSKFFNQSKINPGK